MPRWLTRSDWDILGGPPPRIAPVAVIALAGVLSGPRLADNTALALATLRAARGPILVASSAAVYGRTDAPAAEDAAQHPDGAYGKAKAEMEAALAGAPGVTCLRIGNVAGADALFAAIARGGPVTLDRFPDGSAPLRSYIGPRTLGDVLGALVRRALRGETLPRVLNVASPGAVAMDALCAAAGAAVERRAAPPSAIPRALVDVTALGRLMPLEPADPAALVAEWRALA